MDHTKLVHHHVSITLPNLNPTQLALFSFPKLPNEVRLHFWVEREGFPTTALRFCTHLNYERTVRYDRTPAYMLHNPEYIGAQPPTQIACGSPPTSFILDLNRAVWEELQKPVLGLTALRVAVAARIQLILEQSLGDNQFGRNEVSKGGHEVNAGDEADIEDGLTVPKGNDILEHDGAIPEGNEARKIDRSYY